MTFPHTPVTLATLLALASSATAQINWQPSLEAALQAAAIDETPMLVAIVMPGERGSDAIIEHYGHSQIRKLSRYCVCFRIDVGGDRPDADERAVLERYLGAKPRDPVIVPHHVMVQSDGRTIISSAPYQLTAGQLEWLIVDGIRKTNPSFQWELSEGARAPEDLRYDDVEKATEETEPPPTPEETKKAIEALKRGGGWASAMQHYNVVLRSDSPQAVKFVEGQLRGTTGSFMSGMALSAIGEVSPVRFSPVLIGFLDDRGRSNRENAARGLAKMAHDKSDRAIKKHFKSEKDAKVRGWLIRAAAATAPKDKATVTLVKKALRKKEDPIVRMQAAVAAGMLEDDSKAIALMKDAITDQEPNVRAAAAYAMACRRDKKLAPVLESALKAERDAEARHWLETALNVTVKETDLKEFKNFRTKVLGERRGRDRGNRGRRGGGGNGGGGNGGNGGGR